MAWYAPSPAIPPGMDPSGWRSMIEAVEVEARRLVASPPGVGRSSRILSLEANLRAAGLSAEQAAVGSVVLGDYYAPALVKARDQLLLAQQAHGDASVDELAAFLNANGYTVTPNPGALAATVTRTQVAITNDWQRLAEFTRSGVLDALRGGMVAGISPVEVAARIAQVGGLSYHRGMVIARTEMRDLYTAARMDYLRGSDHIDGWWWRARPDGCGICQALHGEVFDSNTPQYAHHMCRCVMVPHIPGVTDPPEVDPWEQGRRVEAQLPASWPKGKDVYYWRERVMAMPNEGWRPSYRMVRPMEDTVRGMAQASANMDRDVVAALRLYRQSSFELNEWLRSGTYVGVPEGTLRAQADTLARAAQPAPAPFQVSRTIPSSALPEGLARGGVIVDDAFQSFAVSAGDVFHPAHWPDNIAHAWPQMPSGDAVNPARLLLRVKKGDQVIVPPAWDSLEAVMPAGTRLRVVDTIERTWQDPWGVKPDMTWTDYIVEVAS